MLLIILAYLGGVLTILSPCILPVLPFVFARADQPFVKSGLPLLVGMALTFSAVATLAAVGGGWVVAANEYGRWLALLLLAFFGLTLLSRTLADRLTRPLVALGSRLTQSASTPAADGAGDQGRKPGSALLLGVATGLLWAPCAGPILGLILTGAALQGANATSSLLLLAYAAGAATSIAAVLLLGGKVFKMLKRSLGAGEWVRRGLGAAMLAGVLAIGLGWDTGVLSEVSLASTGSLEQKLVDQLGVSQGKGLPLVTQVADRSEGALPHTLKNLPVEGVAPELEGATEWLNFGPLTLESLRGKVVLVDFWTYSCINCLRTLPYVKAWEEKYRDQGLVVIGVHSPEFAFERKVANVVKAKKDLGIQYPVAIDNDFAIWRAYKNQYWPAHYFIDAKGQIRYHHFGEGNWEQSERVIQQLLKEAGQAQVASDLVHVNATGVEQGTDLSAARSPETYLGYERGTNFASATNVVPDAPAVYAIPEKLVLNTWGLQGQWQIGGEHSSLQSEHGRIRYHFQGRDVHLVLAPDANGAPVRYRVLLDGQAPGSAGGVDVAADGSGMVTEQRLYQLIRLPGEGQEHELIIEFLDPGVSAYAFTFG